MLDKTDFKRKAINKGKEGHYIMIRGSIQEEDIKLTDIYAPNIGVPKYTQKILTNIQGEIDENTIILRDCNTPLTSIDRSFRGKISQATRS